ncbi:hypothetical protein [Cedecea sp.]|jgi:hypothetical protein|uniref:hypothetical protein n=1 Tax=Cedecea sp. TaxID=1970739 RepID=UPI002F404256
MEMLSSYADVNQIAGVETFRIEFENTPSSVSQSIYANTRNQVPVVISLKAYGSDGEPLDLNEDNVKKNLYLYYKRASAGVGEQLSWRNTSGALSYDDRKNKYCLAAPNYGLSLDSVQPTTVRADDGTVYVTYYVSANQQNSAGSDIVAVLKSSSLPGGEIDTSGSIASIPVSAVNIRALAPVNYKREDVKWEKMENQTPDKVRSQIDNRPGVDTYVYTYNYHLSCAKSGFDFINFEPSNYSGNQQYLGLSGWKYPDSWRKFHAVVIHDFNNRDKNLKGFSVKKRSEDAHGNDGHGNGGFDFYYRIKPYESPLKNYFCCTAIHHDAYWNTIFNKLPNGPMTSWHQYFHTSITAYDQYGNEGIFYLDTKNIDGELGIYDHKVFP